MTRDRPLHTTSLGNLNIRMAEECGCRKAGYCMEFPSAGKEKMRMSANEKTLPSILESFVIAFSMLVYASYTLY